MTGNSGGGERWASRLAGRRGRELWQTLDEWAESGDLDEALLAEFPRLAPLLPETGRRTVLKLMGASLALGAVAGCTDNDVPEDALPYVRQPEMEVPGRPRYYATGIEFEGFLQPVLGECHVGRPTKLEGNPEHPASRGATDAFTQAAVLGLYDPDRSGAVRHLGDIAGWPDVDAAFAELRQGLDERGGSGFRILTGPCGSFTLRRKIDEMLGRWPAARWHVVEGNAEAVAPLPTASGERDLDNELALDLGAADVVACFAADPLGPGPHQVMYSRQWSDRRRSAVEGRTIARLFVAESAPTLTGVKAGHDRLVAEPHLLPRLLAALAERFGLSASARSPLGPAESEWVDSLARELGRAGSRSAVLVGRGADAPLRRMAHAINMHLGAIGTALRPRRRILLHPLGGPHSLEALVSDMREGRVDTLLTIGTNPVQDGPPGFGDVLASIRRHFHCGTARDETARLATWHLPVSHDLESWGDGRAVDGTATLQQPLVRPLHETRTAPVILARLLGDTASSARGIVRATWAERWGLGVDSAAFEKRWRRALHDGFVEAAAAESAAVPNLPAPQESGVGFPPRPSGLSIVIRPDPSVWDGRFANNGWLQELPDPLKKLTWDNVIAVSPTLARERGIDTGRLLSLRVGQRAVTGPAWIEPGLAPRTVEVTLGYGRTSAGRVGDGVGFDARRLRDDAAAWILEGAELTVLDERRKLATTQHHDRMAGHDFVRTVSLDEARNGPAWDPDRTSIYGEWEYPGRAWAMTIDLDACTGCNACAVACQAENNVPIVGREEVLKGREMHWIRIDRYYEGPPDDPVAYFQPVNCMHCEKAPCEMGCPVNATVHGPEGLNQMVYNRCIGTRTCSSYCPYKVRRFNFFQYADIENSGYGFEMDAPGYRAQRNPDVTVRARGVMEKCTYCVQRIRAAEIAAETDDAQGAIETPTPACAQACPTRAIVFGDKNDAQSDVARLRKSPRNYALLEEANTWPRTTYLSVIKPAEGDG